MAITKEQIFAAADEIDAAGQNATLAAVRKALGGGSFTTISEAVSEWRSRKAAKAAATREAPPKQVVDLVSGLGAEMWAAALSLANGRLASERAALEVAGAQLEAEKVEAAELADQMGVDLDALRAQLAAQNGELQRLRQAIEQRDSAVAALMRDLAAASARLEEVDKRADQLNAELERVGAQNAGLLSVIAKVVPKDPGK